MSRKFLTLRGGVFAPGIIPYWLKLKSYWPKRVVVLEGGVFLKGLHRRFPGLSKKVVRKMDLSVGASTPRGTRRVEDTLSVTGD
jgi:hypothetical protein